MFIPSCLFVLFVSISFTWFREVYNYVGIYNRATFLMIRKCAFLHLAFFVVDLLKSKQDSFDKWIVNYMKNDNFKVELTGYFHQLFTAMQFLEPCCAIFPGTTGADAVTCTVEKYVLL